MLRKLKDRMRRAVQLPKIFAVILVALVCCMLIGRTLRSVRLSGRASHSNTGGTAAFADIPLQTPVASSGLPVLREAPEFTGIPHWLNSAPLTMAQLRGKVVLVDFWTYSCINCLRSLPHVIGWYKTYKDKGFVVIGVSSPEFDFEKNSANVSKAIDRLGIPYPVAQDNNWALWNAYNNECWPAEYLIDAQGRVRATEFGEGHYDRMGAAIHSLLMEAQQTTNIPMASSAPDTTPTEMQSPETYLGHSRQSGYVQGAAPASLSLNEWTVAGPWDISGQYVTANNAGDTLSYHFVGKNVYMVLNPPPGKTVDVQVNLDGGPISASVAGADVQNGVVTVDSDRLYKLVHLDHNDNGHVLTITVQSPGLKAYTFTFG